MAWGSSQEATAVLVAVNYFHTHGMTGTNSRGESTHTTVEEAGNSLKQQNMALLHHAKLKFENEWISFLLPLSRSARHVPI
jgi:hypothetical protein